MVLFWVGWQPILFLFKAESVEPVLSSHNHVTKSDNYRYLRPWLGTGLLTADEEKWRTRRKLLAPAFHFVNIIDFINVFDEQSKILVELLSDMPFVEDMVPFIRNCCLDIICETAMGININAQRNPRSDYTDALHLFAESYLKRNIFPLYWWDAIFRFTPYGRKYYKALDVLHSFSNGVIQERKKCLFAESSKNIESGETIKLSTYKSKRKNVLLDRLIQHNIDGGQLTDEEIREEVDTFMFAGHDTSAMAVSWTLYFIGHDSEIQTKIHEELDSVFDCDTNKPIRTEDLCQLRYLECCVKEGLRMVPSAPIIARKIDTDIEILGHKVPSGVNVGIVPGFVHRDIRFYPNPEQFDPNRFLPENSVGRHPYSFIPFSAGTRSCLGQKFGMLETKTILAQILRHFKIESIGPKQRVPFAAELVVRPKIPLKFRLERRF